jgi:hypothetical protein
MESKQNWYNNEALLGALLLFVPPVGLYALYKNDNVKQSFKNIIYTAFLVVAIIFVIRFIF